MKTDGGNDLAKSLQTFCNTSLQLTAPIKFNTVIIFMHTAWHQNEKCQVKIH